MKRPLNVVNQWTFEPHLDAEAECHLLPSLTVPDQAYTIEELLARHQKGLLTDMAIGKQPIYSEDASFDDPDMEGLMRADIVERSEFAAMGKAELDRQRKEAAKAKAEADKAEEARKDHERLESAVAERLAKLAKQPEKAV